MEAEWVYGSSRDLYRWGGGRPEAWCFIQGGPEFEGVLSDAVNSKYQYQKILCGKPTQQPHPFTPLNLLVKNLQRLAGKYPTEVQPIVSIQR